MTARKKAGQIALVTATVHREGDAPYLALRVDTAKVPGLEHVGPLEYVEALEGGDRALPQHWAHGLQGLSRALSGRLV